MTLIYVSVLPKFPLQARAFELLPRVMMSHETRFTMMPNSSLIVCLCYKVSLDVLMWSFRAPLLCTVTRLSSQPPLHSLQLHGRPWRSEVGSLRHLLLWIPEPGGLLQGSPPHLQHCRMWPAGRQVSQPLCWVFFIFFHCHCLKSTIVGKPDIELIFCLCVGFSHPVCSAKPRLQDPT